MIDVAGIYPIVRHPAWSGWTSAACRGLDGGPQHVASPLMGLAHDEAGDLRPLTCEQILALGDPLAVEARAIANLDALPYTFEDIESTKGFLGMGKKPLAIAVRGRFAAERVCSPAFLNAARARLGGPLTMAVGIPDRDTVMLRNHDAPHFGSAFDAFATKVVREKYLAACERAVCNGTLLVRDGKLERSTYVRAPEPGAYVFPSRELPPSSVRQDGSVPATAESDLVAVPALAPPAGAGLRLLGRHRHEHFIEVALDVASSQALGDAGRAALAKMARAVPGSIIEPVTGVRVVLNAAADLSDLEWSLRHPHVAFLVAGKKKGTLQFHRGPSTRAATDNLSLTLAELAARG